ncbi:MAG TPA: long-chain fatty acid--CoA ligase [Vicinamibacterales bacterium]|jgi:long-chain acyl-CoA synthetase|nr:long-chain fatty acid--CoA ligase [Vicinamibacterales bacterium]
MSFYSDRPWRKHYDYWVRDGLAYPQRPLHEILDATAIECPDRPATSFFGATLTFGEVKALSDRFAASLRELGVAKGDRVGIMLPNCPQYMIAAFAILRIGGVIVNINPTYTARELTAMLPDSGTNVLITLDTLATMARVEHLIVTALSEYMSLEMRARVPDRALSFTDLATGGDPGVVYVPIEPDDLAVLQYTGGTTGTPKGAMLTHANIFANVVQSEAFMFRAPVRGEYRYLMVIPYFHIYAFTVGMMTGTWVGAQQIMLPKYDVEQVLAAFRDHQPTYFPAVPTIYVSLLNHPRLGESGLGRVRTFNTGGAPCPLDVVDAWVRATGRTLNEGYGLSETSPVTHSTPLFGLSKPGSIGVPMPDTDITIVDLETGDRELPAGEAGELCVSGPQVMKGYWQRPDETAAVLHTHADGRLWFHTGDVARVDEDGYTTIVQRKKDLIIVDGFNVYPSEVETVLYSHSDVRLAAVIGKPDRYHGETVHAYVALKPGASATPETLLIHCRGNLAPYKVPKDVTIRPDLPMSAVGKILYRVLREEIGQ